MVFNVGLYQAVRFTAALGSLNNIYLLINSVLAENNRCMLISVWPPADEKADYSSFQGHSWTTTDSN